MQKRYCITIVFLWFTALSCVTVFADSSETTHTQEEPTQPSVQGIPRMYRGLGLGMSIEAVKDELKRDPVFGYRGDRDMSLLPTQNRSLIETSGNYFIRRAWFQFYDNGLYTMIFKLNADHVDYYSIYSNLCKKYGDPNSLNPQQAVWESDSLRLVLERPLTVKYIDLTVFNTLLDQSSVEQAAAEKNLEAFIESF